MINQGTDWRTIEGTAGTAGTAEIYDPPQFKFVNVSNVPLSTYATITKSKHFQYAILENGQINYKTGTYLIME